MPDVEVAPPPVRRRVVLEESQEGVWSVTFDSFGEPKPVFSLMLLKRMTRTIDVGLRVLIRGNRLTQRAATAAKE